MLLLLFLLLLLLKRVYRKEWGEVQKSDFAHVGWWGGLFKETTKDSNFAYNRIMVPRFTLGLLFREAVTFKRRRGQMAREMTRSWARREEFTLDLRE